VSELGPGVGVSVPGVVVALMASPRRSVPGVARLAAGQTSSSPVPLEVV
jgi:hypothetical protein